MTTQIVRRRDGRVLRLTLTRPQKRNALRTIDCTQLVAAFNEADLDNEIGAILLDAEGPDFCSGIDLADSMRDDAPERAAVHSELFTIGTRLTTPIVAAVRGRALGGGLGLVTNAHVAVASEDAGFGLTEVRLALWPFVVFRSVSHAVGERRALELSLTGRVVNASEAIQIGLVHHISPVGELEERAMAVARKISGFSLEAVRRGLDYVHRSRSLSSAEAFQLAGDMRRRAVSSPDFDEGVSAFFGKREPIWPSNGESSS